jgi:tetratricopeptide (TPR) repeat protein
MNYTEVNERSLTLYNEGKWHELLVYGKQAINERQDFVALRLRMGYAACMEENYAEALKHYEAVLQKDAYQETAHDFIRRCRIQLNQAELAEHEQPFINKASREKFHQQSFGITQAAVESGIKFTNIVGRENANYNRLEIGLRLGWNFHLTQSAVLYNQTISEPKLIYVNKNITSN